MRPARRKLEELEHGDPTRLGGVTGAYARLMRSICNAPLQSPWD
jgi:hypothetical protein